MQQKQHLTNAHLFCPETELDTTGELFIADGVIVGINQAPDGFAAETTIDAKGSLLLPGLIDIAVQSGEPGLEQKGTIASESHAALAGGITTFFCQPSTEPVIDSPSVVELIEERAKHSPCKIYPIGAITAGLKGKSLSEMAALKRSGVKGVGNAGVPLADTSLLLNAFKYASTFDLTVLYQAQDCSLAQGGCVHEGLLSTRLGLKGIPSIAESIAVSTALALQAETGVSLHLCRLSCAQSVELVRQAKQQGQKVTADVAIHQLYLTDGDVDGFDSNFHVMPPLRSLEDQQALLTGLEDGTIDVICSDHSPHERNAKQVPFAESAPGISGLDTLLSLVLGLSQSSKLSLTTVIKAVTSNPAKLFQLPQGHFQVGKPADFCLLDPTHCWQLQAEGSLHSLGKNTPLYHWPLQGKVQASWVDGQKLYP